MVMNGMSLGYDGVSSEAQLKEGLQTIIAKPSDHFDGSRVTAKDVDTETDSGPLHAHTHRFGVF